MKYGYVRVSSKDQHEDRQLVNMFEHGIKTENIYIDKQSGKDFNRKAYQRLISTVKEGDVIYIHSIDRLGRNYDEIIAQWQKITKEIKADIIVMDMPLLDTTVENNNLTGRFIADLVLQILSYVAESERNNIRKRQQEGILLAKEQGRFDKKDIDNEKIKEYRKQIADGKLTVTKACELLGIQRRSWYLRCKKIDEMGL